MFLGLLFLYLFYGDALCQIAWLVDVQTLAYGHMVSKKLQRDNREQWSERSESLRNLYALICYLRNFRVAFGDDGDDMSAPCS